MIDVRYLIHNKDYDIIVKELWKYYNSFKVTLVYENRGEKNEKR